MLKIGVMDSGLGGLSLLQELSEIMPSNHYLYYGDIANSPYGSKTKEEVRYLTQVVCEFFMREGVHAIILACNTATSVSAEKLRQKYTVPIFGVEPALKPALELQPSDKVAVLVTPLTAKEKKYELLQNSLASKNLLTTIPCKGLATLIDRGNPKEIEDYLQPILLHLEQSKIRRIVLGCTHYVLVKEQIANLYPQAKLFDGNEGTARHVYKTLGYQGMTDSQVQLDLFLNGGTEKDFELAHSYLNNTERKGEIRYVK
ncbi:MAG: glutamate racemase [Spirochaetota bacterium]